MKVVSSKKMAAMEKNAYQAGLSDETFMEEAGRGIAEEVERYLEENMIEPMVVLLCGKGNNAGDAYVAGFNLLENECEVFAYQVGDIEQCSHLCQKNHKRFLNAGGQVFKVKTGEEVGFPHHGLIIDGLFGTGFIGAAKEPYATVIRLANRSKLPIIAIDIPSGLDGGTGKVEGEVIKADQTLFLGLPKTGFFLEDGWKHVGKLRPIDFGLPHEFIEDSVADLELLMPEPLQLLLPPISRTRHKYQAGVVTGLAGSAEMPGAAMLASEAALRGGAGLVRLLHPKGIEVELSASPYELIRIPYDEKDHKEILKHLNEADAVFVGPGMGRSDSTRKLMKKIIPNIEKPCVIDGDALTIVAEENIAFPPLAILTPHAGEMQRLLRQKEKSEITKEYLQICKKYVEQNNVTLILKGAPSFIFHKGETIAVNPTGDPGMATAGSGDVLTGLIASLLAQRLPRRHAASLGAYLHGLAGEHAVGEKSAYCLLASDIILYFPEAFRFEE